MKTVLTALAGLKSGVAPVVYIAGPMSHLPENNYPAFNRAAELLRGVGLEVLNPAENEPLVEDPTWSDWMRMSLVQVAKADIIATLPNWGQSRGARLEVHVARELGIPEWKLDASDLGLDVKASVKR